MVTLQKKHLVVSDGCGLLLVQWKKLWCVSGVITSGQGARCVVCAVATQPGAGGYRKIAAALLADHGIKVDVLLVSPLAAQRGSSPMYIRLENGHPGNQPAAVTDCRRFITRLEGVDVGASLVAGGDPRRHVQPTPAPNYPVPVRATRAMRHFPPDARLGRTCHPPDA